MYWDHMNGLDWLWGTLMMVMLDGAYSHTFSAGGALLLALAWVTALAITVYLVLRRALGTSSSQLHKHVPYRGIG